MFSFIVLLGIMIAMAAIAAACRKKHANLVVVAMIAITLLNLGQAQAEAVCKPSVCGERERLVCMAQADQEYKECINPECRYRWSEVFGWVHAANCPNYGKDRQGCDNTKEKQEVACYEEAKRTKAKAALKRGNKDEKREACLDMCFLDSKKCLRACPSNACGDICRYDVIVCRNICHKKR